MARSRDHWPLPTLQEDGSILAPVEDPDAPSGFDLAAMAPGTPEHAYWLPMVDPARGPQGAVAGPKPNPELLGDGGILVPVASEPGGGYTMVRVSPGEPEHAEWLASIQRSRAYDPPQTTPVRADPPPPSVGRPAAGPAAGGFAFWDGQTFVGFGVLGLIVAAVLFFTNTGPFEGAGQEECIVTTIGGNTLCGDDARAWCDSTDSLRAMDAVNSAESQAACDKVRDR